MRLRNLALVVQVGRELDKNRYKGSKGERGDVRQQEGDKENTEFLSALTALAASLGNQSGEIDLRCRVRKKRQASS